MKAYDWFKDGSFYLLDTPGHAIGHLCGLARTTTNPDTFIFMGGDACHHGGEFRPSEYLPLPSAITPHPITGQSGPFCPGAALEEMQTQRRLDPSGPFFVPFMGHDIPEATRTIAKVQEADAHENIFVIMAHDDTVIPAVDLFPKGANEWKQKGWAKNVKWAFLKDMVAGLE
jgi:glyoxylase-like metal-dependent hydrolase (beta-lactamase superfamily II)